MPIQYVDDVTVTCSSVGALRAVMSPSIDSACARYALKTKSAFNYGVNKSAAMAMLGSPAIPTDSIDCSITSQHTLLGVLVDDALTFTPFLNAVVRKSRAIFLEMLHAGETAGFTLPVLASQVPVRVEPFVVYGAALLAVAPQADVALNRLQQYWARSILGCAGFAGLPWSLLLASCGWVARLGTKVFEYAIVCRARLFVLPDDHPAVEMFKASVVLPNADCWASQIKARMLASRPPVPDIVEVPTFSVRELVSARSDKAVRKLVLRRYRSEVVRPRLLQADAALFETAASKNIVTFGLPFKAFMPSPVAFDAVWLSLEPVPSSWLWYRCWAIVRMTGKWPCVLFGDEELQVTLGQCGACGECDVTVIHALTQCPAVGFRRTELFIQLGILVEVAPSLVPFLLKLLFGQALPVTIRWKCICFVGQCIAQCLGQERFAGESLLGADVDVDEARIAQLERSVAVLMALDVDLDGS